MSFGTRLDQNIITELTDEWLYNYPEFLENDNTINFEDPIEASSEHQTQDPNASTVVNWEEVSKTSLGDLRSRMLEDEDERATVVDIGQKKRSRPGEADRHAWDSSLKSNLDLKAELFKPRTAATAKKRLIWLPKANSLTAFMCYTASPDVGKQSLSIFFDRHSKFENYFNDDTTRTCNVWETEMHLSFYLLTKANPQRTPWVYMA